MMRCPCDLLLRCQSGVNPPTRRYMCYLLFQLKTHNNLFDNEDDGEGSQQPSLSLLAALGALAGITAIVAVASECAPITCPASAFGTPAAYDGGARGMDEHHRGHELRRSVCLWWIRGLGEDRLVTRSGNIRDLGSEHASHIGSVLI